ASSSETISAIDGVRPTSGRVGCLVMCPRRGRPAIIRATEAREQTNRRRRPSFVTPNPPPSIPWQLTGNHWLALPCIHPADASIHAVGLLHRGARAAIE